MLPLAHPAALPPLGTLHHVVDQAPDQTTLNPVNDQTSQIEMKSMPKYKMHKMRMLPTIWHLQSV